MSKQIYIVLRMRGEPYYGFPKADEARDRLLGLGLKPVSPADLDRANGFDAYKLADEYDRSGCPNEPDWNVLPYGFDLQAAIDRDNKVIDDPETEAIYVVHERISESTGGMAEIERAMKRGKIVLFDTMSDDEILHALGLAKPPVALTTFVAGQFAANEKAREAVLTGGQKGAFASLTPEQKKDILEGKEIRVTDSATGAGTSMRLARFDLIPQDILWEFAELYGRGAVKHGDSNMEGGYPWSWSFQKVQRHLSKFWQGEDTDAETRVLHVLQAAWHCFTLAWFLRHGKGTDDRPKGV